MRAPAVHRQRRPVRPPDDARCPRPGRTSFPLVDYELMGVVNVTPDSFSDGGAFDEPADAY